MPVSLFESNDLPLNLWKKILDRAVSIKKREFTPSKTLNERSVGLLFFEPSSRTRWSFEKACLDMKVPSMVSVVDGSTSKAKGETQADTLDLYLELGFDLVVVRVGEDPEVYRRLKESKVPYIIAGYGGDFHPTQALLDYFTWTYDSSADVQRLLIMGDVAHSRVAKSHLRFSKLMGYQVGLLPAEGLGLSDSEQSALEPDFTFTNREEALEWAQVVMSLRTQKERHGQGAAYKSFLGVSAKELKADHILMHPGPFMRGEDLEESLVKDPRSLIFSQKRNGVFCRASLITCLLEENQKVTKDRF